MADSENNKTKSITQEEKQDVMYRIKAREIVQAILDYGISQEQTVYIIKLLTLELEDVHVMQKINEFLDGSERFTNEKSTMIEKSEKNSKTKIYT